MRVRIVVPGDRRDVVLGYLRDEPAVCNLMVGSGDVERPAGGLIEFDIPLEAANSVISELKGHEVDRFGSITADRLDIVVSAAAERADRSVPGDESQAVVWAEVSAQTRMASRPTLSYFALMALAVMIAAVGILTDSQILIVGAMVVGPEFGPISNIAYGLHRRRLDRIVQGLVTLLLGFALAIVGAYLLTALIELAGRVPVDYEAGVRPLTSFISHPDAFSVVVAALAGAAGTVSLLEARSNALVGVFISVTTVPAAANIGVALAVGDPEEAWGALIQLVVNLTCIIVVAAITMTVLRWSWHRMRRRQLRRRLPRSPHSGR
jgi:uncharacterized hydrophobic protein (TIGR00271 family)